MNFMNLALIYAWQHVAVAYVDASKTLPLPTLNINLGATWLPKLWILIMEELQKALLWLAF